ncbi:MAG: hypothetical protein K6E59_04215 [Bacilli bacterium]|nr:hypothetical protein [Bacilli bacterium]
MIGLEEWFVGYLDSLLEESAATSISLRGGRYVQIELRMANRFLSLVLFDVALGKAPTYEQFQGIGFTDEESVYQEAERLYADWSALSLETAVERYCQYMNRLIDRSAIKTALKAWVLRADYCFNAPAIAMEIAHICPK